MDILGYIGFAVLIFLAVTWTIGVRVKFDAGIPTIAGALFFLAAAIFLGVSGANKLHSLWVVPVGFIFTVLLSLLAVHVPPALSLFKLLASAYASIVRVGIPAAKIKAARDAGLKATIDEWASQMEKKEK
jgi:hypothetical protein